MQRARSHTPCSKPVPHAAGVSGAPPPDEDRRGSGETTALAASGQRRPPGVLDRAPPQRVRCSPRRDGGGGPRRQAAAPHSPLRDNSVQHPGPYTRLRAAGAFCGSSMLLQPAAPHHPVFAPPSSGRADSCPPTTCVGACGDSSSDTATCAASGPSCRAPRAAGSHAWARPLGGPAGPARGAPGRPCTGNHLQKVRISRGPQFPALLRAVPRPRTPLPRPL